MNLVILQKAIEKSWCRQTCYAPENWKTSNPSYGQCAVTSCIVQDYMGGQILWCQALNSNNLVAQDHYFNQVADEYIDFTKGQFPPKTIFTKAEPKTKGFTTTRAFILSYQKTHDRYLILRDKVQKALGY